MCLECVQHNLRRHGISIALKPHKTLRQLLINAKDESWVKDMAGVVYSIPCTYCHAIYIGETGRIFGV